MKRLALYPIAAMVLVGCHDATQPIRVETSVSVERSDSVGTLEGPIFSFSTPSDGFSDDFEADLSQWVGQRGGAHHGVIVEDPLRPGNHVLTFTQLNASGDIFSSEVRVTRGEAYVLRFEYLGLPNGGRPGDLGGAIGFAEDAPNRHRWLAGTIFCCGIEDDLLIDDGQWRMYSIEFDVFASGLPNQVHTFAVTPPSNNTIRVMLEDFPGSNGVAGDAFFDNVRLTVLALMVDIDIKPGSDPNSINCNNANGVITVAILTTADFDATTVDHTTVTFEGASETHVDRRTGVARRHEEDVDGDGDTDLVLHFRLGDASLTCNSTEGMLMGDTFDGHAIEGADAVRMVG